MPVASSRTVGAFGAATVEIPSLRTALTVPARSQRGASQLPQSGCLAGLAAEGGLSRRHLQGKLCCLGSKFVIMFFHSRE